MRKMVILLSILLFVASSYVRADGYDDIIKTYDVPQAAMKAQNCSQFWVYVRLGNERLMKFRKAQKKNSRMFRKVEKYIKRDSLIIENDILSLPIITELNVMCDSIAKQLGVTGSDTNIKIRVIKDDNVNAFAFPDGRIFVHSGLLSNNELTYEGLLGILAHETVHAVLKHAYVQMYDEKRAEFKANLVGGLMTAVQASAVAFNPYTTEQDINKLNSDTRELQKKIDDGKITFHYSYSREQEIEADIIAFRYLEFVKKGLGQEYIKALEVINDGNPYTFEYSDHPSTPYRISILREIQRRDLGL